MSRVRSRQRPLALVPLAWCVPLTLLLAACGGSTPRPPNMSPGFPSPPDVMVTQSSPEAAPVLEWPEMQALSVEVVHVASGRAVWRIEGAMTPRGQRLIASPLSYGAPALPPGVNPPDGPNYHTRVAPEPLAPGERYAATLRWPEGGKSSATFVALGR